MYKLLHALFGWRYILARTHTCRVHKSPTGVKYIVVGQETIPIETPNTPKWWIELTHEKG